MDMHISLRKRYRYTFLIKSQLHLLCDGVRYYQLILYVNVWPHDEIHAVVKTAVQSQSITPVFCGSAYKNKGVQPLLDAVNRYLPSPLDRTVYAKKWDNPDETFDLVADNSKPAVAMAFKIVDETFGQLTYRHCWILVNQR